MAVIDVTRGENIDTYVVEVTVPDKPSNKATENGAVRQARMALAARKRNVGALPRVSRRLDVDELEVTQVDLLRELPFAMRAEYRVQFVQEK